jgi:predicted GIY-YIG superfamily endonuclease
MKNVTKGKTKSVTKGKSVIYALRNRKTKKCYYGSTTLPLKKRLAVHRTDKTSYSYSIAKDPTAYIEVLEEVPYKDRTARERWWIENRPCINNNKPKPKSRLIVARTK